MAGDTKCNYSAPLKGNPVRDEWNIENSKDHFTAGTTSNVSRDD